MVIAVISLISMMRPMTWYCRSHRSLSNCRLHVIPSAFCLAKACVTLLRSLLQNGVSSRQKLPWTRSRSPTMTGSLVWVLRTGCLGVKGHGSLRRALSSLNITHYNADMQSLILTVGLLQRAQAQALLAGEKRKMHYSTFLQPPYYFQ